MGVPALLYTIQVLCILVCTFALWLRGTLNNTITSYLKYTVIDKNISYGMTVKLREPAT